MHIIDQMLKLQSQGQFDQAFAICQKIYDDGPNQFVGADGLPDFEMWSKYLFNRGWFLIWQGLYGEGHRLLENGRLLNAYGRPPIPTKRPIYDPRVHSIKGARLLIGLEGGIGDQIIDGRFVKSYRRLGARSVTVLCEESLTGLISRVEGVDQALPYSTEIDQIEHDFWIPGFSSGWIAGHEFRNMPNDPYLYPDLDRRLIWNKKLSSDKKKIGIRWAGNPNFVDDHLRIIPPDALFDLACYQDLQVYSLQKDHGVIEVPNGIVDLQHDLKTLEDTAAAISEMDLVITSCTSIAHLSAAIGVETWVIVPLHPYHVWAVAAPDLNATPYYKTVNIFRQKELGRWNDPFQRLYRDLEKKFHLPFHNFKNRDLD